MSKAARSRRLRRRGSSCRFGGASAAAKGEGCPLPSQLEGLGECCKLPQSGRRKQFSVHVELEKNRPGLSGKKMRWHFSEQR